MILEYQIICENQAPGLGPKLSFDLTLAFTKIYKKSEIPIVAFFPWDLHDIK